MLRYIMIATNASGRNDRHISFRLLFFRYIESPLQSRNFTDCGFSPLTTHTERPPFFVRNDGIESDEANILYSTISKRFKVIGDGLVEGFGFVHLGVERLSEFGHLSLEGDAVILEWSGADVAAGGKDVVCLLYTSDAADD